MAAPTTFLPALSEWTTSTPIRFTIADLVGKVLEDFCTNDEINALAVLADPFPINWLFPWRPGEPKRVLNLFCGGGGTCAAIRRILGADVDMVCIDWSKDAAATQRKAGCYAIHGDVRWLRPDNPALIGVHMFIGTAPCTDWTMAGKGLGRTMENIAVLERAFQAAFDLYASGAPITADSWNQVRAITDEMTSDSAQLMLECLLWILHLPTVSVNFESVMMEQSNKLPPQLRTWFTRAAVSARFKSAMWTELDAADFGSPSHRRRAFFLAHKNTYIDASKVTLENPLTTLASDAIGWAPDRVVLTRANRTTSGGNGFRMDGTNKRIKHPEAILAITSKIRCWYPQDDPDVRFTLEEICKLVTLPPDHPLVGSRTSQCTQAGDVVAPVVGAAVVGALLGLDWRAYLYAYLAWMYPAAHGHLAQDQFRTAA